MEGRGALQWSPGPRSWRLPYYSSVLAPIVSSSPLNIVIVSHHLSSPQKTPGPGSEPLLARLGVLPEFCTIHQTVDRRNLGRDRRRRRWFVWRGVLWYRHQAVQLHQAFSIIRDNEGWKLEPILCTECLDCIYEWCLLLWRTIVVGTRWIKDEGRRNNFHTMDPCDVWWQARALRTVPNTSIIIKDLHKRGIHITCV